MISHLEFNPQESSYQFLYEIALFDTNPKNLSEIYEVISNYELKASDCSYYDYSEYDKNCSAFGVKEALACNDCTSLDTMLQLASEPIEILRATIAVRTKYDAVIEYLIDDSHIYVLKDLLENPNLKSYQLDMIINRILKNEIDFSASFNKEKHITKKQFIKFLKHHRLISKDQIDCINTLS